MAFEESVDYFQEYLSLKKKLEELRKMSTSWFNDEMRQITDRMEEVYRYLSVSDKEKIKEGL
jgi:hypothetical protein